jgi:hypothetical protein
MHINIQQAAARGINISASNDWLHIEFDGETNEQLMNKAKNLIQSYPGAETLSTYEQERILEEMLMGLENNMLFAMLKQIG